MKRKIIKVFLAILLIIACVFLFYCNNTRLVDSKVVSFYDQLKDSLKRKGFSTRLLVISTKRFKWHNNIQKKFSGAASKSRHLVGDAIDFIVFDINKDGNSDKEDVNLVYSILDRQIIKNKGGIGTYTNEKGFINRQMIHIDCRGYKARWTR